MHERRVGVGVGVVVERDGLVLLVRRNKVHGSGTWSTPGGHIEFGESIESCAVREVMEETSVTVADPKFLAVTNDVMPDDGKHYVTIWMRARYLYGEARVAAEYEMSDVGWFAWSELPSPLFTSLRHLSSGQLVGGGGLSELA